MRYSIAFIAAFAMQALAEHSHHQAPPASSSSTVSSSGFASFASSSSSIKHSTEKHSTGHGSASSSSGSSIPATPTPTLFLGPNQPITKFDGSIVGDDGCQTTFALECKSGPSCSPAVSATITYGNDIFEISTESVKGSATVTILEKCKLAGTTAAACTVSLEAVDKGKTISSVTTKAFASSDLVFAQVPITAGVSKIKAAGTCKATGGLASSILASYSHGATTGHHTVASGLPASSSSLSAGTKSSSSSNAAMATGISEVYKVLVVPGAAALLAGALL